MKSGLLILNNICHVQNFTLYVFSNAQSNNVKFIDDKLTSAKLKVEFKDRKNITVKSPGKLCDISGKISFAENVKYKEGKLDILWEGEDGSITVRMNYEIVAAVEQAYSCDQFIVDVQEIINKNRVLNESDDEQKQLHHFLIPHISGVLHDLYQLENPIDVSYELIGNRVKIHGIPEKSLLEYVLNMQRDEGFKITMPVLMSGHEIEIEWNNGTDEWIIAGNIAKDIPRNGKLQIGHKGDFFSDGNKNHDHNKLRVMLTCLNDLKSRIGSPGHEILRRLFQESDSSVIPPVVSHSDLDDIAKITANFSLRNEYSDLDDQQKRCIEDIFKSLVVLVNGEGGSGKTEVGAFVATISALLGYNTIVTAETNSAIDNFLARMRRKFYAIPGIWDRLNLVRLRSRRQLAPAMNRYALDRNELDSEIKHLQKIINDHFTTAPVDSPDFQLKSLFHDVFSRSDVLERLILLTYNVILTTYGIISERKFFQDPTHKFDLNIIDASSSVNLSAFSLGARNSRKWVLLNDEEQIAPLTVGDFLLKQPLRFPDKEELQKAEKYDPKDADLMKTRVIWDSKKYKESAASILSHFNNVSSHVLKNQYRIHPDLYNKICKAFDKAPFHRKASAITFLDLKGVSPPFSSGHRLIYQTLSDEEIPTHMGMEVARLLNDIQQDAKKIGRPITVGVACTDVASLRKVIQRYQEGTRDGGLQISGGRNNYHGESENVHVTFCSIKSHQEREYDIFVLGIIKITSPDFGERVNTALTRTSSYALVYGPRFKENYGPPRNAQDRNKKILKKLEAM